MAKNERAKTIAALRHIADTLEGNPLLSVPFFGSGIIAANSLEEMVATGRSYGGFWSKEVTDSDFHLNRVFTSDLRLLIYTARENVCERIVVGTKIIPATTLPARDEVHMPERTEELVEWHCPKSLSELVREERTQPVLTNGEEL